jgi:hypothetical protein
MWEAALPRVGRPVSPQSLAAQGLAHLKRPLALLHQRASHNPTWNTALLGGLAREQRTISAHLSALPRPTVTTVFDCHIDNLKEKLRLQKDNLKDKLGNQAINHTRHALQSNQKRRIFCNHLEILLTYIRQYL